VSIEEVVIGPDQETSLSQIVAVARHGASVRISDASFEQMAKSRQVIDELAASAKPVYGVSTGFGALATRHIEPELREELQASLIRSHAAGMGAVIPSEIVRGLMFLRAKTLASGKTGVRPEVTALMVDLLNAGVTPVVYEYGSLGCSGDLAPLAHCALVLMGEGEATIGNDASVLSGAEVLKRIGRSPLTLGAKEGLALINGTDGMLAMAALAISDFEMLLQSVDITASMSVEALLGTDAVFSEALHMPLRPHPGQGKSAANMRAILSGSGIVASHKEGDSRVQDAYSLRCAPQVAGAARDTLAHAALVAQREALSVIDNPVVLDNERTSSNGNFHGAPIAYILDFLAIAVADVASMSERRTDRLLDVARSHGLPAFLAHNPGVDSGYMIAHYTQAAMVAENKRLATPASVDSIPTSAMQEDHVSMGWAAGIKLRRALENLARVIAVEALVAARGIELRAPHAPAPATKKALDVIRAHVPTMGPDRFLAPELATVSALVGHGALVEAVASVIGPLA